jgi:isopenicillin N synthase-like dioxygenase
MAGDALEATTAGVIRPAVHRVGSTTVVRHSAVIFVGADYDLHLLVPSTGDRMAFGQHLEGMLVRTTPHL